MLITLAQMAEENSWCHNLLESILQEVFSLASDNRICSILMDISEHSSKDLLIKTCVSDKCIVRQTALRLIMMASFRSPYIFHYAISELLSQFNSAENINNIEALIRLAAARNISNDLITLKVGIMTALEQLLIDEFKMDDETRIQQNLNVLDNLLLLLR